MSFITRFTIGLLVFCLVGCGYITPTLKRDKSYLYACSIPPMHILPGMKTDSFRNDYPISDRCYPAGDTTVNIIPPGLNA